jgi:hypothetical protein
MLVDFNPPTSQAHIEQSNRAWWPIQLLNRWLSMRLELTGAVVVFVAAVGVAVIAPKNAGLAGLALTSALNLTGTLAWMVRQTTELEVNMNSGQACSPDTCSAMCNSTVQEYVGPLLA